MWWKDWSPSTPIIHGIIGAVVALLWPLVPGVTDMMGWGLAVWGYAFREAGQMLGEVRRGGDWLHLDYVAHLFQGIVGPLAGATLTVIALGFL